MSGIAAAVQHRREKNQGIGTNSQAVKYLNQDYEALRQRCFESGRLFQDESFPALPSSLGFNELGPNSYKVRGVSWQRPTVSEIKTFIILMKFGTDSSTHTRLHLKKVQFKAELNFLLVHFTDVISLKGLDY